MKSNTLENLVPFLPLYFGSPQFEQLKLASTVNTNVLLVGSPGLPFELAAQAVHLLGSRSGNPFLTADHVLTSSPECEAALFGKGNISIGGSKQFHKGLVQAANGGTLYFGDLTLIPSHIQHGLMNAVDRGSVIPIGSTYSIAIDVKLIAATDQNPGDSILKGLLRKDFYFWISTSTITLASINDRRNDIPPLAIHLLQLFTAKHHKSIQGFSPDTMDILKSFAWDGEIRQLENAIERSVIFCGEAEISPTHLPEYITNTLEHSSKGSIAKTLRDASADFQKQFIIDTLRECSSSKELAALQLGISLSSLYRKLEELKIFDNQLVTHTGHTTKTKLGQPAKSDNGINFCDVLELEKQGMETGEAVELVGLIHLGGKVELAEKERQRMDELMKKCFSLNISIKDSFPQRLDKKNRFPFLRIRQVRKKDS